MDKNRIVDAFFNAMNKHDVIAMADCCSVDIVADEVAESEVFSGIEAFKQSYADVFRGYPDCTTEILERYGDGDTVICQVKWKARNTGVFRGAEPTGKPVEIRIAYFLTFAGDKISRITEYYDLATILSQQGQLEL